VQTPDLPNLPWTLEGGVKVFNLTAEVVKRKFLPAKAFDVWGTTACAQDPR
jgi:manganese oxidase